MSAVYGAAGMNGGSTRLNVEVRSFFPSFLRLKALVETSNSTAILFFILFFQFFPPSLSIPFAFCHTLLSICLLCWNCR
jgi:hypothetical protein